MYRDSRRLRLALALLIVTSFTLITVDYRAGDGTVLSGLRRGISAVVGPVQRAVTTAVRPIGDALSTIGDLGSMKDDKERLAAENERFKAQLRETDELRRQLDEMSKLLAVGGRAQYALVPARVIALGATNFEWTATIDSGARDGLMKDMTVINGDGLVGRVLSVTPWTATVLLANDAEFAVAARVAATGELGTLAGDGLRPMTMEMLNSEAVVVDEAVIVTAGSVEGFNPGIPIGVVSKVQRTKISKTLTVTPYVSFTSLDIVGVVITKPREQRRDDILPTPPPRPTPSATPTPTVTASPSPTRTP